MAELTDEQKKKEDEEKAAAAAAKATAESERGVSRAAIGKALAGLKFRTNKGIPDMDKTTGKPVMEDGKPKLRYVPDLRPMMMGDVLSAAMVGDELVIVTKDGSKHRVAR